MEDNKNSRLLISFVLDNGITVPEERLQALTGAFAAFAEAQRENSGLEFELIAYDGFAPTVVKSFEQTAPDAVKAARFPLLGRATMTAVDRLISRVEALKAEGVTVHRPWVFLLSDGYTVDSMEEVANRLDGLERSGDLLYLPFKLSPTLMTDRLQYLDRSKHMIEIKEGGMDGFFAFVNRMIEQRASLEAGVGIKFVKTDFEGWAEL